MINIRFKKLDKNEIELFIKIIRLFEDVFEMKNFKMPEFNHLKNLLQKEKFDVFAALFDDKVAGGLTVYTLDQYYSEKPLAYIYDLAVKKEFQRKGIGKKLIDFVKDFYRQKDFEEVFVQADKVDDYAVDFYRKTGVTDEEDVIHFYYNLKKNND